MKPEELITDEQIESSWGNAIFGYEYMKRDFLNNSLLKVAIGHKGGHTITQIMQELSLIRRRTFSANSDFVLTEKGQNYVYSVYSKFKI